MEFFLHIDMKLLQSFDSFPLYVMMFAFGIRYTYMYIYMMIKVRKGKVVLALTSFFDFDSDGLMFIVLLGNEQS